MRMIIIQGKVTFEENKQEFFVQSGWPSEKQNVLLLAQTNDSYLKRKKIYAVWKHKLKLIWKLGRCYVLLGNDS